MSKIELKIEKSKGFGKDGKQWVSIRPDYYCFNKARKAKAYSNEDLQDAVNTIIRKWYSPELFVYEIDGQTIVSNNEDNALTEYWRVCDRNKIGAIFTVATKISPNQ